MFIPLAHPSIAPLLSVAVASPAIIPKRRREQSPQMLLWGIEIQSGAVAGLVVVWNMGISTTTVT